MLHEKLIELREQEIDSLKQERNWLRERIEKLEEKGDRDQLLLLSETQVLRQLLIPRQRTSPVRAALEWLGVVQPLPQSPPPLQTGTIEVAQKEGTAS